MKRFLPQHKGVLALLLALFLGMGTANAYDFSAICSTGQTLYYNITDATNHFVELTFPGTVANSDFWTGYTQPSGDITLPSSVTYNGVNYTVKSINWYAFYGCEGLTGNLVIPSSVTLIEYAAFMRCNGFTGSLIIPNSVTIIENEAFEFCYGFTGTLVIGASVTSISSGVFNNCRNFSSMMIYPETPPTLGTNVFGNVPTTIPVKVPCGNLSAYQNASGWSDFTNMQEYCDPLTYSINPDGVSVTVTGHVDGSNATGEIFIPETKTINGVTYTVTAIGDNAFRECSGLTGSLILPNTVTTIGEFAFYLCSGFTGILTIPNAVTTIKRAAFYGCSGFTGSLTIPSSVTEIGMYAFTWCDGFTGTLTLPDSITELPEGVFEYCQNLSGELILPNYLTTIGQAAFLGCSHFTGSLTLPNTVTTIGINAFYNCFGFDGALILSSSLTTIDNGAFNGCFGFMGPLTIPNSVTSIGNQAFYGCNGFTGNLTIGHSVASIGINAFCNCPGFTHLNYNAINCADIPFADREYPPFQNFTGTISFDDVVQRIPAWMFYSCTGFTGWLNLPNSLTSIGESAFEQCSGLTGWLILPESLTEIGAGAFYNCSGFSGSLTIPSSLTTLGNFTFSSTGFTSLTIPESITSMGIYAFGWCNSLSSITVRNETPPDANSVFYNVSTDIPVYVPCGSLSAYQAAEGWSDFTNLQCIPWTVTLSANPWGGGYVNGGGTYANGASCTVQAIPHDNYQFMHWSKNGEVFSCSATCWFNVYQDTELEAVFVPTSDLGTIIGEGENTNNSLPSHSYYNYTLSEQIYTASELGGSFTINNISFFNAGTTKTRTYDIYLKHDTKTTFSNGTDWISVTSSNKVYSGSVTMRAGMWTTIVLDTPFAYNGTSNLVLVVDDNTGSYSSGMSCRVYSGSNQAIRVYSDVTNYNPGNPSSYSGSVSSVKNQIMFNRQVYTITATSANESAGTVSGGGTYGVGDVCRLKATANENYTFLNWTKENGEIITSEAEYDFIVSENRNLVANFLAENECSLTFNLYDSYGDGWYGNYLVVDLGNGTTQQLTIPSDGYEATYILQAENGSHIKLNWIAGSWASECSFEVSYSNGNIVCTSIGQVLDNSFEFEFDMDCDAMPSSWVHLTDGDDVPSEYLPSYSYYKYGLSQQIYTADEIGTSGGITSIAFYNYGEDNTKTRNYDVYLKSTDKFEFFGSNDWISVTEHDRVFSGEVTMASNEWTLITFEKPFVYDGTSNLVLVMDDNSGNYTDEPNMSCLVYYSGLDQAIRVYSDLMDYNPSNPSAYYGTLMNEKNQVYFGFNDMDCWPPVALTATDITTNSATLNWEGFQDSYNMRYRVKPYFYEDFESGLDGWTVIQNGEGNSNTSWHSFNASGYGDFGNHSGDHVAASFSWYNGTVYNVDNWLITPQVTLNGILSFWVRGDASWPDKYYVCVSTTQPNINAFTVLGVERYPTGEWTEVTIDLSAYAGQQGYIAIHHQDEDNYYLFIDDFGIYSGEGMSEWVEHNNITSPVTIAGLNSATNYVWQVQGISTSCDGGATDWSETATFTTVLCSPEDQCELSFELTDSYGDGWNGAAIRVVDVETGIVLATMTNVTNDHANAPITETYTLAVCDGRELRFEWVSGSWDSECSYVVTDADGNEVLSGSDAMSAPVTYMVNCGGEQTIALSAGWNWVSFNVETTLEDLEAALLEAYPDAANNALVVKSKSNGQTAYNTNAHRWIGGLQNVGLDLSQMYMVKVPAADEITVEGMPINPEEHPITIASGVNWIAFPLSQSMSITDAFAGFPTNGDIVKAKGGGQAQWNSGASRWIGALSNTPLQPGQGYIYNSKATGNRTFTFPVSAK